MLISGSDVGYKYKRQIRALKIVIKHGIVSIICGATEYFLFIFLYIYLNTSLAFAYPTSFFIASVMGYLLHDQFTFKSNSISRKSAVRFSFQALMVLLIGYLIINFLIYIDVPVKIAKIIQLASTFLINVTFGRYFTFKQKV